jgi:N-methylhydantoinase B
MNPASETIDAVSLGIMWDRLIAITDEIVSTLVRTSFSSIVRESYDLTVVLMDAQGRLIAQGTQSLPVFMGTAPVTLARMLETFPPDQLEPGDVIITNDPWIGTGHLFDINVMRPVFRGGAIVAYTLSITHLPDVGGTGFGAAATEIQHEGLRLPVCRLMRRGQPDRFILDLIRANVRVPEQVVGDLMANVAGNEIGSLRLLEFMDEYAIADLAPLSRAIRRQSERAARERIAAMPSGSYASRIDIEGVGAPITLACRVEIAGDALRVDFAGSGPCVRRGINVPFCYTRAMALYAIKCITSPSLPNNEGSTAPVAVSAPAGCILNAQPPFPTGARHAIGHFVTPLVFAALQDAAPGNVQADCGMMDLITFQGTHPNGRAVSTIYFASGGFGALAGHDGLETTPGPSNMAVVPVEVWETLTGTTIEHKRLLPDSGGAGASRGGLGQEVVIRNDTGHAMSIFSMANRTAYPAQGFNGGRPGALREHRINGHPIDPMGRHTLQPGDRLILREAGGGGFGDPRKRSPRSLQADIEAGFVTPERAPLDYGETIAPP